MSTVTPLHKQYLEIKARHRDAILLFRIGDFYETFDEDARLVARELDIVLTSKPMGKNRRLPLAGIPHHSLERHLATLISRGHRVAICEQLGQAPTKGEAGGNLIERGVVRIVTPGTVLEPGLLQSKVNNYIAAYMVEGKRAGIAYADVTTGDFAATELDASAAIAELQRIAPSELLIAKRSPEADSDALPGFVTRCADTYFALENARRALLEHFGARTLAPYGLSKWLLATAAAGALITYLRETQTNVSDQLTRLKSYHAENFMLLDVQTIRSLEIFESESGGHSLLAALDRTRTPMGGRLLRRWLRQPLLETFEIVRRQDHVAWFCEQATARDELFATFERVHDLERLSARARAGLATAQEILSLGQGLEAIPRVQGLLHRAPKKFHALLDELPLCEASAALIRAAINDELLHAKQSGVIRTGYSKELDTLRSLLRDGKKYLAEMEQRERARTGIKSLRVGYNKVFGYFIEVTRPNLHLVPEDYTRKQTLAQGERFITLELKEYEALVTNAQERIAELEPSLFRQVCHEIGHKRDEILRAAAMIAYLDAIASLAAVSAEFNYTRPKIVDDATLQLKDARHPVVERILGDGSFVANDVELGGSSDKPLIALITGPNMSGKSTYLRQTALIVLMAQMGSFVPAREATIGLCDRVFTRIGLYDRINRGESTFMTEMVEMAEILQHATARSLILLDELGRGTSTYDGLAVARAVVEYIHNHPQIRAKTLFATHYHELTELAQILPRLVNLHVEIAEQGSELEFLYRISPGRALRSYGVYAAKLAGLPRPVVRRATQLLNEYEARPVTGNELSESSPTHDEMAQASSSSARAAKIVDALLEIDTDALSPVEALMKLYELRQSAATVQSSKVRAIKTA
jgi:DNA mismatch repair protein MutS